MDSSAHRPHDIHSALSGCLTAFALAVFVFVGLFYVLSQVPSRGFKERIYAAIAAHYTPLKITIKDSEYLETGGSYYEYAQICVVIQIARQDNGMAKQKVVMVAGDDDGGTFRFAGEYDSMQQCKSRFNLG